MVTASKKKNVIVHGRNIDLQCFAYDIFVYSARKFGVPDGCICSLEVTGNDYLNPDFIVALSRIIFECQIKHRFYLNNLFKNGFKSKNLETFGNIQRLLQNVILCLVREREVFQEVVITLSVINEFILFLFSRNCKLYLKELSKFWFQYWCIKKSNLEKAGGLAKIYEGLKVKYHNNWEIFFDQFIPEFCIPYELTCVSTLADTYNRKFKKFFEAVVATVSEEDKGVLKDVLLKRNSMIFSETSIKEILPSRTSELGNILESNIIKITGIVIPPHDELLWSNEVSAANSAMSSQNFPNTSPEDLLINSSCNQKPELEKKSGSCSIRECLNMEASETYAAISFQNRQEIERARKGSSILKQEQEKKSSLSSGMSFLGIIPLENKLFFKSACVPICDKETFYRRTSISQKLKQEKNYQLCSSEEHLSVDFLQIEALSKSPKRFPSQSRNEKSINSLLTSEKPIQVIKSSSHSNQDYMNVGLLQAETLLSARKDFILCLHEIKKAKEAQKIKSKSGSSQEYLNKDFSQVDIPKSPQNISIIDKIQGQDSAKSSRSHSSPSQIKMDLLEAIKSEISEYLSSHKRHEREKDTRDSSSQKKELEKKFTLISSQELNNDFSQVDTPKSSQNVAIIDHQGPARVKSSSQEREKESRSHSNLSQMEIDLLEATKFEIAKYLPSHKCHEGVKDARDSSSQKKELKKKSTLIRSQEYLNYDFSQVYTPKSSQNVAIIDYQGPARLESLSQEREQEKESRSPSNLSQMEIDLLEATKSEIVQYLSSHEHHEREKDGSDSSSQKKELKNCVFDSNSREEDIELFNAAFYRKKSLISQLVKDCQNSIRSSLQNEEQQFNTSSSLDGNLEQLNVSPSSKKSPSEK